MQNIPIERVEPTRCEFLRFVDCDWNEAWTRFKLMFGVKPANVIREGEVIYAGPVPEGEVSDGKENRV